MYDVVISGAGPSGSKCAETIAKRGYKVALLERDSSWRKPCGGAVSASVLKYFPKLRQLDFQKVYGINIFSANYHKLDYSWKGIRNYSINVDRLKFDNVLREVAVDAGAELFDKNIAFDFIYENDKKIGIKTKTKEGIKGYEGKILVIADGMSSKLAYKSGIRDKWKINNIGITKTAILEGDTNLDENFINIFFRPYIGYSWIFPLSNNRFNIGVGTWMEENLNSNISNLYNEFLNEDYIKKLLHSNNYKHIWSASYPLPALGVSEKSLYDENLMIIGDAAGFVSPINGEGIHASIVSGFCAGETAVKALDEDDINKKSLKRFKQYPNIKKILRNFKMKRSMVDFFFENRGANFSKMLELAEKDPIIKEQVVDMFLFSQAPPRELLLKIKS